MKIRGLTLSIFFVFTFSAVRGQFFEELTSPQLNIPLTHPPELGILISKLAFGPSSGLCSGRIIRDITSDLINGHIQVLDQTDFNSLLSDHGIFLGDRIDQENISNIEKVIGPSALVFIHVQRCGTSEDQYNDKESTYDARTKKNTRQIGYFSRTQAFLTGNIRVVDLTTGQIFAAQTFNFSPGNVNKSLTGYPGYPDAGIVREQAFNLVRTQLDRMFLPWIEATKLYYFNDKAGNLKQAFDALKAQDLTGAFDISEKNLEADKNNPKLKSKILGHAFYNMGMSYLFREEFDSAMDNFHQALRYSPGTIITQAMATCQKEKRLSAEMQQLDQSASVGISATNEAPDSTLQGQNTPVLTNADVIQMSADKLPPAIIIAKINHSTCKFDTSPASLSLLTKSGVDEKVIEAMISSN
ncbi:MAG TPA: hypothetical protein VNE41_08510 [Chitinophagaceae bacterium]|nr:hypothetical protein [Chitinophagaceae bacterium]